MASRWIRIDTTWSSSAWLAELGPAPRLCWIELLCYVKAHGTAGKVKALTPTVASRLWGVTRNAVTDLLKAAEKDGALVLEDDMWVVTGWAEHQQDATAPERMRRYRQRQQQDTPPGAGDPVTDVTRNDTSTETETETETVKRTLSHARAHEGHVHAGLVGWLNGHSDCLDGLDYFAQLALWGLYGPDGTDPMAWGSTPESDRPRMLAAAVHRWSGEGHERINNRLFRKILGTVIEEQANGKREVKHVRVER